MDIQTLLTENAAMAARAGEIRAKRSWLPRMLKNWLRNSDGEAECFAGIVGNQGRMVEELGAELAKLAEIMTHASTSDTRLFSDLYVVHSLPKVGGMSIAATLLKNFETATVFHVHCLTDKWSARWKMALSQYRQAGRNAVVQHLHAARKAAMLLEAGRLVCPKSHKRAIICGIREPISWALSLYFEGFSYVIGDDYSAITVEKVAEHFFKNNEGLREAMQLLAHID